MSTVADRVKETTTTEGTGTYSLAGAATGFRGFVAAIGTGERCYYCVEDGTNWEVGVGTVTDGTPDTLSRDRILASSNSGNAVDWGAGTKNVFVDLPAVTGGRERLTANRTYYVRTDGDDSNNGLADTTTGAFLTIQKAVDEVAKLDISIFDVTIQLADGTYDGQIEIKHPLGSGSVTILGNVATPANVVITTTTAPAGSNIITNTKPSSVEWSIESLTITSGTTNTFIGGVHATTGGKITLTSVNWGTWAGTGGRHMNCERFGYIAVTGNYTIAGSAAQHMLAFGGYIGNTGKTITLSGTPAFSQFVYCPSGYVRGNGNTFSGGATGQRYYVDENGVVYSGSGGSATYFPGNAAGTAVNGGVYI